MLLLADQVEQFLSDLARTNRSPQTLRAYRTDLRQFVAWYDRNLEDLMPDDLRAFFQHYLHLQPTSRARKEATLASFLHWAYCQDFIPQNPMEKIKRVKLDEPAPRGLSRTQVEAILAMIPREHLRDQVLFRLVFETGVRIGEALALHIEDLALTPDDEHLRVHGKGGRTRTLLLDDPRLVHQLRRYLRQTGYRFGPLFRAEKNGRGGPIRYQSIQALWARYCRQAGISCTLHQLRHTHATELINDGVSLGTIRKRLGHQHLQTTLRYAEQSDATADAEIRAWRRLHRRNR